MQNESLVNKLEQGRAAFAFKCAEEGADIEKSGEYRQYTKKIPTLIKTNGLGATLAFINAKSKNQDGERGFAYKKINDHIRDWLLQKEFNFLSEHDIKNNLVKAVVNLESSQYRIITNEVLSFLGWLSRFAEGLIKEGGSNAEQG